MQSELKPCPFCGAPGKHVRDYARGMSVVHRYVVCSANSYHLGGVGCYGMAPGHNGASGKCDYCWKNNIECVNAAAAWNRRADA